ncbi:hypothetical protein DYB25_006118 [Aphanomyces astaci]|uniref:Uncharacterized protein n=1 Tax=Aphanomyces astaci TaxID=112090 RepID=A0A397BJN9_APHAT|nr:hypothetical protein DYB25_006118 [Aphanomyces astaci]
MKPPQSVRLLDVPDEDDWTCDPCLRESYDSFHALAIPSTYASFPDASIPDGGSRAGQRWDNLVTHCYAGVMDIYAATTCITLIHAVDHANQASLHAPGERAGCDCRAYTSFPSTLPSTVMRRLVVKAIMSNVLMANAIWDWGKHDRAKLPPDHAVRTKAILVGILSDLGRVLMLPTFTRGRHRFTTSGMHEAKEFMHAFHYLCRRITFSTTLLHRQVEVMKDAGLPANEASRINQYHWYIQARIDKLCHIKLYRTPQATRSFTRLCILALPLLYGPYYVYIATAGTTNFAFALTLSMATSLIMIGIFNVEKALEDPFTEEGLDGVKVERAMHRILDALDVVVPPSTTPRAKK